MKAGDLTVEQAENIIFEQAVRALEAFLPRLLAALPTGPGEPQKKYNVDAEGHPGSFIGDTGNLTEACGVVPDPKPAPRKTTTTVMEVFQLQGAELEAMLKRIGKTREELLRLRDEGKAYDPIPLPE